MLMMEDMMPLRSNGYHGIRNLRHVLTVIDNPYEITLCGNCERYFYDDLAAGDDRTTLALLIDKGENDSRNIGETENPYEFYADQDVEVIQDQMARGDYHTFKGCPVCRTDSYLGDVNYLFESHQDIEKEQLRLDKMYAVLDGEACVCNGRG